MHEWFICGTLPDHAWIGHGSDKVPSTMHGWFIHDSGIVHKSLNGSPYVVHTCVAHGAYMVCTLLTVFDMHGS